MSLGRLLTGHFPWDLVVTGPDCASSDTLGSHPEFSDLGSGTPQHCPLSISASPPHTSPPGQPRTPASRPAGLTCLKCPSRGAALLPHPGEADPVRPAPTRSPPRADGAFCPKTFPTLYMLSSGPHSKVLLQHASSTAPPPPLHLLGVRPGWTLHPALPACHTPSFISAAFSRTGASLGLAARQRAQCPARRKTT